MVETQDMLKEILTLYANEHALVRALIIFKLGTLFKQENKKKFLKQIYDDILYFMKQTETEYSPESDTESESYNIFS